MLLYKYWRLVATSDPYDRSPIVPYYGRVQYTVLAASSSTVRNVAVQY